MRRAIELAKKGCGYTNPNPLVGAVIVKDQRIIGEGYHEKIGGLHAERNALKNCIEDPEGAEIYVTLEPLWKNTTMYGSVDRSRDQESICREFRSQSESGRGRDQNPE